MSTLYDRKIELTVSPAKAMSGVDLSVFRIRFQILQSTIETPNSADIRVYNVAESTASLFTGKGEFSRVRLSGGYQGNSSLLFDGTIVQTRAGRESPVDTFVDITAADGDIAYNSAYVNGSLVAGATTKDHLDLVMRSMKQYDIQLGHAPTLTDKASPRGRAIFGMARDQLRDIAQSNDSSWSIQNGKVVILPNGQALPGSAVILNSETGLLGLPQQTQLGIIARTLINPLIKVGALVKIDQKSVQRIRIDPSYMGVGQVAKLPHVAQDGLYRVLVADHFGDTRGNDWFTECICIALGTPITQGLIPRGVAIIP